jgi:cobalt-zinc-cadmium efflux system outer membrane protein
LTLDEAQGIALANHPALGRAGAQIQAARGQWLQAGLGPNPQIGYLASEIGNDGRAGQQGGLVSKEFVTGGKLELARQVASRDVALAEQRLAAQRLRVLNDVRVAFFDVLISQRRLQVAQNLSKIGEQVIKTAEALRKAKEASTADVLRAQIEAEAARIELSRAQFQLDAAWRSLSALMGVPSMPMPALAGDAEPPSCEYDWQASLQRLLSESPEMAAAVLRVERARWALSRAQAEPIPNVTLEGSVQHDSATRDTFAGVQASIPIPLFNRNQGNILAAQSELRAAERDVDRVALGLQQRLAIVFSQHAAAQREASGYKEGILDRAKTTYELVDRGYRQGEFNFTDVLTAQRTYFQAHLTYLNALREVRAAEAKIEGLLLTGSLED